MKFNLHKPPSAKITQCVLLQNIQFSQWSLCPAVWSLHKFPVQWVPLVDILRTDIQIQSYLFFYFYLLLETNIIFLNLFDSFLLLSFA